MKKLALALTFLPSLFAIASTLGAAPLQAAPPAGVRWEQRLGKSLPLDVSLNDENGQPRELKTYFGTLPVVLVFSYFQCPNLCTLVLNGLVDALKGMPDVLGKDYQVVTISIDPREKPPLALAKKRSYLARLGISESRLGGASLPWHFLTGDEAQVRRIAGGAGFHYRKDPGSGEYAHPAGIVLISPQGRISQYFTGIQFDPQKLHQALATARAERAGTWVEEVLLYCFHYDSASTRNGPRIMEAIRISGLVCVLALLGFFFALQRAERRARRA